DDLRVGRIAGARCKRLVGLRGDDDAPPVGERDERGAASLPARKDQAGAVCACETYLGGARLCDLSRDQLLDSLREPEPRAQCVLQRRVCGAEVAVELESATK